MKTSLFKRITLGLMLFACLCFTAGCGASGSAEEEAAQDTESTAVVADPMDAEFDMATAEDSPEWVSSLDEAKDANQLFIVAGIGPTTAYVSMHQKDEDGNWKQVMTTPGYIGKYGLGKTKEGDAMTPIGVFHFNGYHYNEMVSIKDYPDLNTEDSEHIVEYVNQYQYCLNISWNEDGTPGAGSAIFLHCLGPAKPYTGGCVAIPKNQMIKVMQNVQPDCVVLIDSLKVISPEQWEEWEL